MKTKIFAFLFFLVDITLCSPFDDGKYDPKKYKHDAGKYFRPVGEGKYIPGDEGKYTYVYRQGLYPTDLGDYRYIHVVGPNDDGDYKYIHIEGPNGPGDGPGGPNGPNGGNGPDGPDGHGRFDYIGYRIYADQYPFIHEVIESFTDKFVSKNYNLYGDGTEVNEEFYKKVKPNETENVSAVKCQYMEPDQKSSDDSSDLLQHLKIEDEKPESTYYNFRGLKTVVRLSDDGKTKKTAKIEYEVTVRILEELTEVL